MDKIIVLFLTYGLLPTCLLIVLFLIVQEPERAVKLKVVILEPFYKFFKWFSREYISSKVSSQANEFFNSSVFSQLSQADRYELKVKWVQEANDPILSQNGTLILRLKEEEDQTKNVLSAVYTALPHVLCPLVRKNINSTCSNSIDLIVLKKLSEKLGNHGRIVFKKYFLDPQTDVDARINELITKLQQLDKHGFFIPIFVNELEHLSESFFANNDNQDYSDQVLNFLEYLLTITNREIGSEIQLEYLASPFKVTTILLAKAQKAGKHGLRPYLNRLKINLDKGSESIYIISFPPAFDFFDRLLKAIDGFERVFVKGIIKTTYQNGQSKFQSNLRIATLTRNDIYVDELFEQKLNMYGLAVNSIVKGIIEDISQNECLVNVSGMNAYISKNECSWIKVNKCEEVLSKGSEYEFTIIKIDKTSNLIYLSLKHENQNPWHLIELPKENEIIEVFIKSKDSIKLNCTYDKLEVYVLLEEVSWFFLTNNQLQGFIGKTQKVKVISRDNDTQKIFCSIRELETDPWPQIHDSLKIGMEFNGKISDITPECVMVKLPNNYIGSIPKESLEKAGHEYKNFNENMIIGQGINVFVSKVFIAKQRIRLDLTRNKN